MRNSNILLKLSLFTTSLLVSLSFAELSLRALGFTVQTAREASFDISKHSRDEQVKLRKKITYNKWVVALGDSLTNGSNVPIQKSYPFQLYFKKENIISSEKVKFNILNHGICESNTYQSLVQLKEIVNKWNKRPDILIFLGGAADRFSPISNSQQERVDDVVSDIGRSTSSFFKNLRLFKIFRGIKIGVSELIFFKKIDDYTEEELIEVSSIFSDILEFYNKGDYVNGDKIISNNPSIVNTAHLGSILNAIAVKFFINQDREGVVNFTLDFLKRYPQLFSEHARYPLYRLVMAYDFQSKYSAEYIANSLTSMRKNNPSIGETHLFKKYLHIFKNKEQELVKINSNRLSNLRSLAKLCKESGIKLILQNYPANFTEANIALKQVAKEYNLPFVDNNSVFNGLYKKGKSKNDYLAEDEHPSALGYKIMADNVWKVLLRMD
ncbi:hypothetical protein A9Q84_16595 [Halobacteriovorax marinus]|uniref:SGNH hydrolase-type esterase domain-containing protein n=1 Tax=Halobacteriovorax marinus TaxID=97084 RepID=A0A1Y5F8D5_9BACT|nr:hypothetical protein A9Q84_16595 [Halobacteriovorax marinus]